MQSGFYVPDVLIGSTPRVGRGVVCLILLSWLLYGVGLHDVRAQDAPRALVPLAPSVQAKSALHLLEQGRTDAALPILKRVFAARPALTLPDRGAVAYWLGEAYTRVDDTVQARDTWYQGFHQMKAAGGFDSRLADAYLRTLSRKQLRTERQAAVTAYVQLLRQVGAVADSTLLAIQQRRIAQIAPLLPDDVLRDVVTNPPSDDPASWAFRSRAGEALVTWWRGLDPYPATDENERLEEHVTRLVHARKTFSCPRTTSAIDARGRVYLRFGAPFGRRDLSYKDAEFFRKVFRFGVHVSQSDFPESELWTYPQIDDSGVYLFAEENGSDCFRLATTNDLLPSSFTTHRGTSDRSLNIAYSALIAMRAIYEELALYHNVFSGRYTDIANYAGRQEMRAAIAKASTDATGEYRPSSPGERSVRVGKGIGQTVRVFSNPSLGLEFPSRFVSEMVTRAEQEDAATKKRREKNMPRQYTALREETPQLPVAVRTARFLTDEGSTRTEVYWGVRTDDARLKPDDEAETPAPSLIRFSAVRYSQDRSDETRRHRRYQLPANPRSRGPTFVAPPVSFTSASEHHLKMEWTQHRLWQNPDGSVSGLGPKRRFALARSDSLRPIHADASRLEMSDLKALSAPDSAITAGTNPLEAARPYPFRTIAPDRPLLLSFEVYHLTYGPDDRTDYTIRYTVKGETHRGWTRLFRGQDTQETSTTMTRSGTSRQSDEVIVLDLSAIAVDESQNLRVTVRVTDEHTERTVTRSLDFVLGRTGAAE